MRLNGIFGSVEQISNNSHTAEIRVYVFMCWGEGGRERGIMDNDNRLETEARGKKADQTE